jgi:hypothetical protein
MATATDVGSVPMRPFTWVARGLWLVIVVGLGFALTLDVLPGHFFHAFAKDGVGEVVPISLIFVTVGAVIASKRPRNPIGWIFLGVSSLYLLVALAEATFVHFFSAGSWLPGAENVVWFGFWGWMPALGVLATFVLLLFPDGRLPSRRWWPLAAVSGVVVAVTSGLGAALAWPIRAAVATSAFGLGFPQQSRDLTTAVDIGEALAGVCMVLALVAVLDRYRHGPAEERQQLKWLTYGAIGLAAGIAASFTPGGTLVSFGLGFPGFLWFTACVVIAMLRYRLYDIDVIVNRTLVYGALTALLAGVYLGAVFGLGALVRSIAGHGNNGLVVAASTLAVAALFTPARRRVQAFIDRSFYRRKYDAARTLESFGARLRDDVDLDELSGHLVGVVRETMQPAKVSLWLRDAERAG